MIASLDGVLQRPSACLAACAADIGVALPAQFASGLVFLPRDVTQPRRHGRRSVTPRAGGFAREATSRVIVLAIPDWGVTPFAMQSGRNRAQIASQLDAFNAAAQHIAEARGARFVDTAPVSRERGGDVAMLAEDGLHPSGAMYALWAEAALPAAEHALGLR